MRMKKKMAISTIVVQIGSAIGVIAGYFGMKWLLERKK